MKSEPFRRLPPGRRNGSDASELKGVTFVARFLAPRTVIVPVTLGVSDLDDIRGEVRRILRRGRVRVVLDVVDFEYFDEQTLSALTDLAATDDRLELRGVDNYATVLLDAQAAGVVDVRSAAERMLTNLDMVTVITAARQNRPLDDLTWQEALSLAAAGGRAVVTVDLRDVDALSAHQLLTLAEFSADLARATMTLVIVNETGHLDRQLRT